MTRGGDRCENLMKMEYEDDMLVSEKGQIGPNLNG